MFSSVDDIVMLTTSVRQVLLERFQVALTQAAVEAEIAADETDRKKRKNG